MVPQTPSPATLLRLLACLVAFTMIGTVQGAGETLGPGMSDNTDRPGGDIASGESLSPQACLAACRGDKRCKSWTYVRPGVQVSAGACYLKNSIPPATSNPCCISGFRGKTVPNLTGTTGPTTGGPPVATTTASDTPKGCSNTVRAQSPLHLRELLGSLPSTVPSSVAARRVLDESRFVGCIIIPRDVVWRMEDPCGKRTANDNCVAVPMTNLEISPGVSLIGERGALGSRPTLYADYLGEKYHLFHTNGEDVRIEGLHLRGPSYSGGQPKNASAIWITRNPANKTGVTLIVDNEIAHWTGVGVDVKTPYKAASEEEYKEEFPDAPYFDRRRDATLVRIERNYFHDNLQQAVGGYGVAVGHGGFAQITGNVFDTNRHSVASGGEAHTGYIARFNYILSGGRKEDSYYNQHFDVHGTGEGGYGSWAGTFFDISENTFRGDQLYYGILKNRPAFMLRGRAKEGAYFNNNVLVHDDLDAAVALKATFANKFGLREDHDSFNFHAGGNLFGTDHSLNLGVGDFDGDGRSDVFVATGTAWFFSRGGRAAWEFLRPSRLLTRELGLADIDNDGVTDILARAGDGGIVFFKSGRYQPTALTPILAVPMSDVRFADFDGDARTDMFYTRGGQWQVWYGRNGAWTPTQTSTKTISDLLFGDFDGKPGADVAALDNGNWSISSNATETWTTLNAAMHSSLKDAVAADFDGDGRVDIAFNNERGWAYSQRGSGPAQQLRQNASAFNATLQPLRLMSIGRFDGDAQVELICMHRCPAFVSAKQSDYFMIWRGGVTEPLSVVSWHPMR